jgi:hypothetical protein
MVDEIAQLKTDIEALNLQCQLARDHEIRYALQRNRLEADRIRLLIKLVEAQPTPLTSSMQSARSAYSVIMTPTQPAHDVETPLSSGVTHESRQQRKPPGLPTVVDMVMSVLRNDDTPEEGMAPCEITNIIRNKWWPTVKTTQINSMVWRLAKEGRLHHSNHRYRLNGHASPALHSPFDNIGGVHAG